MRRTSTTRCAALWAAAGLAFGLSSCASTGHRNRVGAVSSATVEMTPLPGTGKPPVTIGDKNFTEQFVLGELYKQALEAKGYTVFLNRNIGPTEVTIQALESGRLDMYPEYIGKWNAAVAGDARSFGSARAAYRAGRRYALAHGLELLEPTAFSDTDAIGVTLTYALENRLKAIADLTTIARTLTLGAPLQFKTTGLVALERTYGLLPAAFKALDVGEQYQALDQGTIQAADVSTTDGELTSGSYKLLRDPSNVFGWGNVTPVVSAKVLAAEGLDFAATINAVSALLTTAVMRQLNADVDAFHQDPAEVARQFLLSNGIIPAGSG